MHHMPGGSKKSLQPYLLPKNLSYTIQHTGLESNLIKFCLMVLLLSRDCRAPLDNDHVPFVLYIDTVL